MVIPLLRLSVLVGAALVYYLLVFLRNITQSVRKRASIAAFQPARRYRRIPYNARDAISSTARNDARCGTN